MPNPRSEWRNRQLRAAILATHGPVCWLDGQPIDLTLHWPHPMSMSIDHVTPLHDAGHPYNPTNARPAHLRCNIARGNRTRKPRNRRTSRTW